MDLLRNAQLLRQFLAVAREGSLTAAAKSLAMTQPALTKGIHRLEDELGAELFERLPRGVALTTDGRMLLEHAQRIDTECRMAGLRMQARRKGQSGLLRVGAGLSFGAGIVPRAVVALQKQYPGVDVELITANTEGNFPRLQAGELDLLFGLLPPEDQIPPHLIRQPMVELSARIVAGAAHPLAHGRRVRAEELAKYPWVVIRHDREQIRNLLALLTEEGGRPPRLKVEVTSLSALIAILQSGPYLSYLSEGVYDPGIVFVSYPRAILKFQTGVVYSRALERYKPAGVLIQMVKEGAEGIG